MLKTLIELLSRQAKSAAILLSLAVLLGPAAPAQVLYGSLTGEVRDPSGSVIPKASVTATRIQTGELRTITTNNEGMYSLNDLPEGTYNLQVTASGFTNFLSQNIDVRLNSVVRVDAKLTVGSETQTLEVNTTTAQLQTDSGKLQSNVSALELEILPQPTFNYAGLLGALPGVAPTGCCGGGTNNPAKTLVIEANGTSQSATDVRIEGISAVNPWVQYHSTLAPSIDSIETINIVTGSAESDQTLAGGSTVNVVLKSGTNSLHGSVYWFHTDNALKAYPYFQPSNTRKPKFIDNDFGATLGGPILRNRLFFFAAYEGQFTRNGGGTYGTVPTAAVRAGDFSQLATPIYDPGTGNADGTGKAEFTDDIIPTDRITPVAQQLLALLPQPNVTTFGTTYNNNYFASTPNNYNLQSASGKVDWDVSKPLRISGRVNYQPYNNTQVPLFGSTLGDAGTTPTQRGNIIATTVAATYVVSPTLVIDGTFGFTRANQLLIPIQDGAKYGADTLHISGVNESPLPAGGGVPDFYINGYTGYGYGYPYLQYLDPVFQYATNTTWVKGPHTLKFGGNMSQQHMNHIENNNDGFTFSGGATALNGGPSPNQYNGYADFLLGAAQGVQNSKLNFGQITLRTWQYALYANDKWDVNKQLTLTYGTGWEYFPVPSHANHGLENYLPDTNQYQVCGYGGIPKDCGIKVSNHLFTPNLGFAFRPYASAVLRGGFSLSYEQINMARDGLYNYPEDLQYIANSTSPYIPISYVSQGIPVTQPVDVSTGYIPLPPNAGPTAIPKNFVRGYVESYNFTAEKSFGNSWIARAGFVGTHTVHQHTRYNINYGQVGGGVPSERLFPVGQSAEVDQILPLETMHYNSLQASLIHRFAGGYLVDANYTYAKWIGTCCDINGDGNVNISIPQYFDLNIAPEPLDIAHNFHLRGIAELPFGKGKPFLTGGVAAAIAGGWRASVVFTAHTGRPFSITANGTSLNAPGSTQRADQVKRNVNTLHSKDMWFDTSAYQPVTDARFGTASFDSIRGPGMVDTDFGIFRDVKIRERLDLQFQVQAFNLTNTPHLGLPNNNVSAVQYGTNADGSPDYGQVLNLNGFGQITSTNAEGRSTDERNLRVGLRIKF